MQSTQQIWPSYTLPLSMGKLQQKYKWQYPSNLILLLSYCMFPLSFIIMIFHNCQYFQPHYSLCVLAFCFLDVSPSDQYKRLQNQFVPHPQQVSQRTRGYKPIHLQANPSSRNFISPQYSFVPRLKTIPNRRHDRKVFKNNENQYKNRSPIIIKGWPQNQNFLKSWYYVE